ncbi:MAG: TonB family protein [Woeseiaceae bacterium]
MALEYFKTQVLLLHSEQSTLDALSTGFNDRYSVHCATTGSEALSTLGVTPIHVIVSAQDLPGMSGLDALREAKKRSPETIGILLAGRDQSDGLEALVGDKEVFQIVRGEVTPETLRTLIDNATKRARLIALSDSANDTSANVDEPMGEHIVMETSENGSTIISDGTGTMPALKPHKIELGADIGSRGVDILVLTKDEEFLSTIKDSARGLHKVHHAVTPTQAEGFFKDNKIGVLVTDAAMVGSNIEVLTQRMRGFVPRLVAIVAGRRDDGELLMDLINRGQVYRFLLKPVSPGRARLAIEASVKHHLEAGDNAFKPVAGKPSAAAPAKPAPVAKPPQQKAPVQPMPAKPAAKPAPKIAAAPPVRKAPTISSTPLDEKLDDRLDDAFGDDSSFAETMTGIAASIGKTLGGGRKKTTEAKAATATPAAPTAPSTPSTSGGIASILRAPKIIAGGAGALVLLLALVWMFSGSETPEVPVVAGEASDSEPVSTAVPRITESSPPIEATADTAPDNAASYADLLDEARIARDAGEIIAPVGSNAIELYVAAREAAPDDLVIASELNELVNQVLGMAESALLAQKTADADLAINAVRMATPDNPRLAFLDAQLSQLKYRNALDDARAAIREKRFEDAARQIGRAQAIPGVDVAEARVLSQELANARSEQRIDEVLALAASRLESDRLISPSNDNARYYYELALSNDPTNTAAQQGLVIVASKLVLKARTAIDNDQLDQAENTLNDARALDPANGELAAATLALQNARQARIDAANRAEAEREAERQRQAAAERAAEQQRQADAKRRADEAAAAAAVVAAAANPGSSNAAGTVAKSAPDSVRTSGIASEDNAAEPASSDADTAAASLSAGSSGEVADAEPAPVSQEPEMVGINALTRTKYVAPKYPRNAMRRDLTGFVDVGMTVARDGSVYNVTVLNAKPESVFNEAALEAVQQWEFEPVIVDGQPVERRTAVRMAFEIQ